MARTPKSGVEMTSYVMLRLTSEEKVLLKMAAARLDMTLSDFVRYLCLPYARDVNSGVTPSKFRENAFSTASGTADYFSLRYQASEYSPSPSPEPPEGETQLKPAEGEPLKAKLEP